MAIEVIAEQKRIFKKSLTTSFIAAVCRTIALQAPCSCGVPDRAGAFREYEGSEYAGQGITETPFVIYETRMPGRGFRLQILPDNHGCRLELNVPCTDGDIALFYMAVAAACTQLGADTFRQDGEEIPIHAIGAIQEKITAWNAGLLLQFLSQPNPVVFGAVYPIFMENEAASAISASPQTAAVQFANYLFEKQKDPGYYYSSAILYQNKTEHKILGSYPLTEGVESIFPLHPYIPFFSGVDPDLPVDEWIVSFAVLQGGGMAMGGKMPFDLFAQKANLFARPRFDREHVILCLDRQTIEELLR